jgi:acetylornithine/succinyldiaminopimelate/putrescine aminotransferase/predicted amino acid dehydrogenase
VLAIEGSYHGTSLGARSVLGRVKSHALFEAMMRMQCISLPPDGIVDLDPIINQACLSLPALVQSDGRVEESVVQISRIIAAIVEPIRGEGGVMAISSELLQRLSGYVFPLIIDEIQCGLGRSGSFLASEGIRGHYYLLGKALGGAVVKISALLIERDRYVDNFDEHYSSTFAGDAFSCAVADRVLDVIDRDEIPARAEARGHVLRERLEDVKRTYPDIICAIRGKGLMLGIELDPACVVPSFLLRTLARHEYLGILAASYLLNCHGVRTLPTISAWNVLRVQPSAYVDDKAIEKLAHGLMEFCKAVRRHDGYELTSFLVEDDLALGEPTPDDETFPLFSGIIESPAPGAVQVAFLNHFILPERDIAFVEPTLVQMPPGARRALFHRLVRLLDLKASICFARNLFGGRVWFASIVLPVDSAMLEDMHRSGKHAFITERIQQAVDWSKSIGCTVAGLGAYTSILTANGTALQAPSGMRLTTGNALTVAAGVRRIVQRCGQHGLDPSSHTTQLAIVGASGNIGSAIAYQVLFGERAYRSVTLLGRNSVRLEELRDKLLGQWRVMRADAQWTPNLCVATEMSALRDCNVILAAAGTSELLIGVHHLSSKGPVLLADLSVPSVVSEQVAHLPHVHWEPFAGTLCVSGSPDFAMAPHIRSGSAFCCAAEVMLLGLVPEETSQLGLIGRVDPCSVQVLDQLAQANGFYHQYELDSGSKWLS